MIRICPSRITFLTDTSEVVWSSVVGLSCTKIAVRKRSLSTVMVRGLSVFPSLHWENWYRLSATASMVAVLASQSVVVMVALPPSVAERLMVWLNPLRSSHCHMVVCK